VAAMQREPWTDFWNHLGLVLCTFEEVGLIPTSPDTEIWLRCQEKELVLVTDNRNRDGPDSLESAIQAYNTPTSLPVFTIGKLGRFQTNRTYADRVLRRFIDYLLDIDRVRGAGRLYLP
jgi:hypothetical protein